MVTGGNSFRLRGVSGEAPPQSPNAALSIEVPVSTALAPGLADIVERPAQALGGVGVPTRASGRLRKRSDRSSTPWATPLVIGGINPSQSDRPPNSLTVQPYHLGDARSAPKAAAGGEPDSNPWASHLAVASEGDSAARLFIQVAA